MTKRHLVIGEEVREIPNTQGLYSATSSGEIISNGRTQTIPNRWGGYTTRTFKPKVLSQTPYQNHYMNVMLSLPGEEARKYLVHRLVLSAFTEWRHDKHVNHIDGDRKNNNISNLEWVTVSENCKHTAAMGRYRGPCGDQKIAVGQRKEIADHVKEHGAYSAAREYKISYSYARQLYRRVYE